MHRLSPLLLLALVGLFASACQPADTTESDASEAAQLTTPVEGVWKTVEVSFSSADTSYANEFTRPSLLIFTKGHYASLRIGGPDEPRALLPEEPTDEQRLAAQQWVRMSGGTYEVSGSSMTTTVIMHHNPNAMAEGRTDTSTFEVDGDVMTRTLTNEVRELVVKYERRE